LNGRVFALLHLAQAVDPANRRRDDEEYLNREPYPSTLLVCFYPGSDLPEHHPDREDQVLPVT